MLLHRIDYQCKDPKLYNIQQLITNKTHMQSNKRRYSSYRTYKHQQLTLNHSIKPTLTPTTKPIQFKMDILNKLALLKIKINKNNQLNALRNDSRYLFDIIKGIHTFILTIMIVLGVIIAVGLMGIVVHAKLFINPVVVPFVVTLSLAVMAVLAFIVVAWILCPVVKYFNVCKIIIVNAVNSCLVAQHVSSAPMHVMVHVYLHCPAVMTANVDKFVKSFHAVMVVNLITFVAVYHAVTMTSVTSANVFKDVNFAIALREAIVGTLTVTAAIATVTVVDAIAMVWVIVAIC